MTSRQEIYVVDISLAQLPTADSADAVQQLLALAADAERRRWLAWSLEAKLAAWELLRTRRNDPAAGLQRDIEASARKYGFGRIVNRLHRYDQTARRVHG